MKSARAHRGRERSVRSCVAGGLRGALLCVTLGLAGLARASCGSPAGTARVAGVDERLEITLADGRIVRLGGLDAPGPASGAPETAKAARAFLTARLLGRDVELDLFGDRPDRWGRVVADLSIPEAPGRQPLSIASALLAAGLARVWPEVETRGCSAPRLAIEDEARRAGLGIWRDPRYFVIQSSNSSELRIRDGQFVIVEGRVRRVGIGNSRIYLDLAPFGGPTIVIARKLAPAFERAGLSVGGLVGQTIRARGALDDRSGARIEVDEPAMIEIPRPAGAFEEAKPDP